MSNKNLYNTRWMTAYLLGVEDRWREVGQLLQIVPPCEPVPFWGQASTLGHYKYHVPPKPGATPG
jgi:hypothetical protein